ncbi:MAG TPA: tryptophan synthase subunit alpha [Candidatus Saccharimonadales bacterium]
MINKIDKQLAKLRESHRKGLMTHVVVGYPSLEATIDIVQAMDDEGVDFIELQIPFSDPLADGPIIQGACEAALQAGTKVSDSFKVAAQLSQTVTAPLLFMAYFNTVYMYGTERFCKDAAAAGISGLIVPDVPLEAARHEGYLEACRRYNVHNIITVAPTSTQERLRKNAEIASGFVYCMSRQGVTGTHQSVDIQLQEYIARVRKFISTPLAVGFGISNRDILGQVTAHADIAVIGSAIIDCINNHKEQPPAVAVKEFLRPLTHDLDATISTS